MVSKKIAAQLEKLQGDEWDSDSDSETTNTASNTFDASNDLVTLPTAAEAAASSSTGKKRKSKMQRKKDAAALVKEKQDDKKKNQPSNVIYLGRVPHGFYEKQMLGFFKQFGVVRRVRLSRNKRTGNSKHYAFIQFDEPEVAQIVANTMNEYRLFDHTLSCHIVPSHAVHEHMFVGANKEFKPLPRQAINRNRHNAEKSYEQTVVNNKRLVTKERQKRKVLKALGIDYDFPGYEAQMPAKKQHIAFT
ncbi:RNA recognition motif-containing protein [Phytophthora infestans]|uniref:RNA recognition motif-containing protein n=1 Tax=Phytophthora infestans TaxID=4787 RepID=A0A833T041_PHYIN|nr:RNA recognition motif-containing protein [Phytophthora infestans]KAF4144953.1 RNA recognition motif-containing protein [Phytophthora infestans]